MSQDPGCAAGAVKVGVRLHRPPPPASPILVPSRAKTGDEPGFMTEKQRVDALAQNALMTGGSSVSSRFPLPHPPASAVPPSPLRHGRGWKPGELHPRTGARQPRVVRHLYRDRDRRRVRGRRFRPAVHDSVDLEAADLRPRAGGPRADGSPREDRHRAHGAMCWRSPTSTRSRRRIRRSRSGSGKTFAAVSAENSGRPTANAPSSTNEPILRAGRQRPPL